MATLTFFPDQKIIEVDSPATLVSVQELVNAIAVKMAELLWMDDARIARWTGKDELQLAGEYTGITLTLLNGWRLKFADRAGPDWVQCFVVGGNILSRLSATATDPIGEKQNPIAPAAYVMVVIAQAASPTYSVAQANKQLQITMASLIGTTHVPSGNLFYVDPINGNNNWSGLLPEQVTVGSLEGPKKTFAAALALCQDSHHDAIFLVQTNVGAATILTETITIDVEDLMVYGPGPGFVCKPAWPYSQPTITITAPHVCLRNFAVEGDNVTATPSALSVEASETLLENMFVRNVNGNGISFNSGANTFRLIGGYIYGCTGAGIHFDNATDGVIRGFQGDLYVTGCAYGMQFEAQGSPITGATQIRDCTVYNNALKGIQVGSGYEYVTIADSVRFGATDNGYSQIGGLSEEHNLDVGSESTTNVELRRTDLEDYLLRALGLSHENAFVDNTEFDSFSQMTDARVRLFDSKSNANAATDGGSESTGLIATYTVEAEYEGQGQMKSYRMVKE